MSAASFSSWRAAHIYYHEEDLTALLLDSVRPLLSEIAASGGSAFFVRHWIRGPHVRVVFRPGSGQSGVRLRGLIERETRRYLAEHPSTSVLDERALAPVHRWLAAQEREAGTLFPFRPNNSIRFEPFDRRETAVGGAAMADLLCDFYVATNRLAFDMLDAARKGRSLLGMAVELMFAVAAGLGPGIASGFICYRSHAEGFLLAAADPPVMRRRFDEIFSAQQEALRASLRSVLASLERPPEPGSFATRYVEIGRRFAERTRLLLDAGEADPLPGVEGTPDYPEAVRARLAHSRFHASIALDDEYRSELYSLPWFQVYRIAVNFLYLHFGRLGIKPKERYVLCHLAGRAVESELGVRAEDLIAGGRLAATVMSSGG
jgi:hypothetical protein